MGMKYSGLLLVFLLPALIGSASGAIYVENATVFDFSLNAAPAGLSSSLAGVAPRIFTEHVDSLAAENLIVAPVELNNSMNAVRPRIFTEHVDSLFDNNMNDIPTELNSSVAAVRPRIFTEHVDSLFDNNMNDIPTELNSSVAAVRPRIFTEHLDSLWNSQMSPGLPPTPANRAPENYTEVNQSKSDGTTQITVGGATAERTVVFSARVSDPDGDKVRLQVELRRTDEYLGEFNESKGGLKESELVANGSIATVSAIELINGNYHWRARTVDANENKGPWQEFGENPTSEADFTVSQAFRFVQLSDVHIGPHIEECFDYSIPIKERNYKCYRLRLQSVDRFSAIIKKVKADNPDFVLVTGDIVEWNNPSLYQDFNSQIVRLKKDVYIVPGNHDRRGIEKPVDKYDAIIPCIGSKVPCMQNYINYIGSKVVDGISGDYSHGNYYFDYNGYRFIGLDSGYDPDNLWKVGISNPKLKTDPTGSGLSPEQVQYVRDNALYGKTIVFMHHPTNDIDNNYNTISQNREQFINLELEKKIKLTLAGHTHDFRYFYNPETPQSLSSSYVFHGCTVCEVETRNLLVQTRSIFNGYTLVDITPADDKEMFIRDIKTSGIEPGKILSVFSPADLHVYDEYGRHTGINVTGGIDNQIPDSYYLEELQIGNSTIPASIMLYNNTLKYSTEIVSNFSKENITTEQSHFNFTIEERTGGTIKTTSYNNITIEANSKAYIENVSQSDSFMQVDLNNDGTNETVKTPDAVAIDYAPTAIITSPANNSIWDQGQAITFSGTGTDPEDGALSQLVWISDRDDVIGQGNFITSNLSAGIHYITMQVNDSKGQVNTSSIFVTIRDTMPPSLAIDYPMENKTFKNSTVNVKGKAYDDSGISNVTVNGVQAGQENWNASVSLSEGENRIEVVATDSKGFSKTSNRTVYYNSTLASDTQPPAIITNLTHETGSNSINGAWINWTWDNPIDQDFSYAIIQLDNIPMGNTSRSYFNFTGLSNDADYNISILTADIVDNINYSEVKDNARTQPPDTASPQSITDPSLQAAGTTWLNFTWLNPPDPDFSHVMLYLNGSFKTNITAPQNYYNFTGLAPDTVYELGTHTVDTSGNINLTWVNATVRTAPDTITPTPSITVVSPDGGENWARGTIHTIRWNYSGTPGSFVNITLLKSGIFDRTINSSTSIGGSGSGSYSWLINPIQAIGTDYKIMVTSTTNPAYNDTSNNNFNIPAASLTIVFPNGEESLIRGTTQTIKWNSSGSPGAYVKIELLKSGIFNRTIIASTPNDGKHPWLIPATQAPGTDYKVKITSTTNASYNDTSDNSFTIPVPSFKVVFPNGKENWTRGTTQTIKWNSTENPKSYVKIELMKAGIFNRTIIASTLNDGSHPWLIPAALAPGKDYKIRVSSTTNLSNNDTSDNSFTIPVPSFTVVSPNGSENWTRGTTQTIKWNSTENPKSYVKIELMKAGILNRTIIASTLNDGSHPWLILATLAPGTDYKIRVSSTTNLSNNDTSDNSFTIPVPSFTVVSPNGSENWTRGTTQTIKWNSTENPKSYVKIELMKAGILNRTIIASTLNDGSHPWLILATLAPGTDYKIRVSSTTNLSNNDTSDNSFTIPVPSFTVVSPNGSENWTRGTTQTIRWNSTENLRSYVKIELLKAGILNRTIIATTLNDGSNPYLIPADLAPGNDYKVRITSTINASIYNTSDNFGIIPPKITVTSPNGGEKWIRGTAYAITWNYTGNPGTYVKIELLKNGALNRTILSSTLNDKSQGWTIPATQAIGADYKIRITSTTNLAYNDTSDSNFNISSTIP